MENPEAGLALPTTPAALAALEVAREYHSPSLVNHCIRSYLFAAELGRTTGLPFDDELLFVASMLHDIGLADAFDHPTTTFEVSGGDVAEVFTTAAGWPRSRRARTAAIIVAHMADTVDPALDPEGHLLCESTGLDISGRAPHRWPTPHLQAVLRAYPRLTLPTDFLTCFTAQATRKPTTSPAAALASGLPSRLTANPLDTL
ncbi:HD domain-containing protein [Herbiconiux sp. CPCC 203407]|uniref:HD domain-containing protein n=1 Tax=Herbiconiux oxytropis TaxID=2970915 RepID=A0AA41XGP5_9MICO|nr:HD domain-containing protein [Herbiconiux oxytropis]MCS5723799.1 HD domain-containing protein [Herbiconiux oxytropis]MCS5725894.1 HD domain-containing protein [Herbiconiux oxytropis]